MTLTDKFKKDINILDDIEKTMKDKSLSQNEKDAYIQTSFLAMILEDSDRAKTYCKLRKSAPSEAARKHIDALLGILGNLLSAQLGIYKSHGANYRALVSVLNAGADKITEIEKNGDQELVFDELILKYGLADKHYPALSEALKQKGE